MVARTPLPSTARASATAAEQSPFARICCVADDSPAGCEAASQAAALAVPGSDFCLIAPRAVTADSGGALAGALRAAVARGASTLSRNAEANGLARLLLVAARERELLVVPPACAGPVLARGAWPGRRRPLASVLIARPGPAGRRFPDEILLISGSSPDSLLAARLAAWIAAQHNSSATLLHVGPQDRDARHRIAETAVELIEATGVEPVVITAEGAPHKRIIELVRREQPALIVLGDRRRGPLDALRHPGDRVAHLAPCSVLIAPSELL